jgi:CHASE3 domain sensor protein
MVSANREKPGLTLRTMIASGLLAVIIGATFAVLFSSVAELQEMEHRAQDSEDVLVAANRLERLVVDLETGQRGFLLTGSDQFLQPWIAARAAFPQQAAGLESLVAGTPSSTPGLCVSPRPGPPI